MLSSLHLFSGLNKCLWQERAQSLVSLVDLKQNRPFLVTAFVCRTVIFLLLLCKSLRLLVAWILVSLCEAYDCSFPPVEKHSQALH